LRLGTVPMIRAKRNVFSDAYPSGCRNSKLGDQLKNGMAIVCPKS
jgi:hypothetical protein